MTRRKAYRVDLLYKDGSRKEIFTDDPPGWMLAGNFFMGDIDDVFHNIFDVESYHVKDLRCYDGVGCRGEVVDGGKYCPQHKEDHK